MTRYAGFFALVAALGLLAFSAPDSAEAAGAALSAEVEISRNAIELSDAIRTPPVDRDSVNTALVFNNTGSTTGVVYCTAFDSNGRAIGRARAKVPARGLRFMWASDLANGRDFIGSAICSSDGHMAGSVVLLGAAGTTDLTVEHSRGQRRELIRFTLIATY